MRNGGMEMLWTLTLPVSEKTADLDHWMEEYATPLLRLCTMILRDRQMAEEAVQDTLYRGYRGYAKFRGGSSEQTWLTRIAVNVCRDRLRRPDYRRERQGLPLSAAENQEDASRERRELLEAVCSLPAPDREVLLLRYYTGLAVKEIACVLSLSEIAVSARLKRARDRLRQALA